MGSMVNEKPPLIQDRTGFPGARNAHVGRGMDTAQPVFYRKKSAHTAAVGLHEVWMRADIAEGVGLPASIPSSALSCVAWIRRLPAGRAWGCP